METLGNDLVHDICRFGGAEIHSVSAFTGKHAICDLGPDSLLKIQIDEMIPWIKEKPSGKVANVKVTTRLDSHACVITAEEMAAARHFIRTQSHQIPGENRFASLQQQLEINPKHPIMKKLYKFKSNDAELGELIIRQLFSHAMVGAGLAEDPRLLLMTMNDLLGKILDKH